MRSDLKKLDSLTLEMSKNHHIRTFLRNGCLRVKEFSEKGNKKEFLNFYAAINTAKGWNFTGLSLVIYAEFLNIRR